MNIFNRIKLFLIGQYERFKRRNTVDLITLDVSKFYSDFDLSFLQKNLVIPMRSNIAHDVVFPMDLCSSPSPLILATQTDDITTVNLLIQQGVNLEERHKTNNKNLDFFWGDLETMSTQRAHLKKENIIVGGTALMFAAASGYTSIVNLLIKAGANVEARSHENETALMLAIKNHHEATATVLLQATKSSILSLHRNVFLAQHPRFHSIRERAILSNQRKMLDIFKAFFSRTNPQAGLLDLPKEIIAKILADVLPDWHGVDRIRNNLDAMVSLNRMLTWRAEVNRVQLLTEAPAAPMPVAVPVVFSAQGLLKRQAAAVGEVALEENASASVAKRQKCSQT